MSSIKQRIDLLLTKQRLEKLDLVEEKKRNDERYEKEWASAIGEWANIEIDEFSKQNSLERMTLRLHYVHRSQLEHLLRDTAADVKAHNDATKKLETEREKEAKKRAEVLARQSVESRVRTSSASVSPANARRVLTSITNQPRVKIVDERMQPLPPIPPNQLDIPYVWRNGATFRALPTARIEADKAKKLDLAIKSLKSRQASAEASKKIENRLQSRPALPNYRPLTTLIPLTHIDDDSDLPDIFETTTKSTNKIESEEDDDILYISI
jgi:hypothetical protein